MVRARPRNMRESSLERSDPFAGLSISSVIEGAGDGTAKINEFAEVRSPSAPRSLKGPRRRLGPWRTRARDLREMRDVLDPQASSSVRAGSRALGREGGAKLSVPANDLPLPPRPAFPWYGRQGSLQGDGLDSRPKRVVHSTEHDSRLRLQGAPEEGHENPSEGLPLSEHDPAPLRRFHGERMLPVEESRDSESAEPPQFLRFPRCQDSGPESCRGSPEPLQPDRQLGSGSGRSGDLPDEGIPGRVAREIRQHSPDLPLRRPDPDVRSNLTRQATHSGTRE